MLGRKKRNLDIHRQKRIDLNELFLADEGYVDECIEERLQREKKQMIEIIVEKNLYIDKLKLENEKLQEDLIERNVTLQKFKDKHCELLWDVSKIRNQRWIMANQVTNQTPNHEQTYVTKRSAAYNTVKTTYKKQEGSNQHHTEHAHDEVDGDKVAN